MTQAGCPADCTRYGPGQGGRWVTGEIMGPGHGGPWGDGRSPSGHGPAPWSALPPGWRCPDGSYGMAYGFTTS